MLEHLLEKAELTGNLTEDEIVRLLELDDLEELSRLYACAYRIKTKYVGKVAWFRGIIELSNICSKDCYYCGIRRSNTKMQRYMIPEKDIIESAVWVWKAQYGSAVLQSGERSDPEFVDMMERVIKEIKLRTNNELGLTLSLGEQSEETYRRWFAAGGHRYLLRIETSSRDLYAKLHPADHSFDRRLECLKLLKKTGYQVGTGVMIGLPMQNSHHLAKDLMLFKDMDIDMIGMGPYIFHHDTPLIDYLDEWHIPDDKLLHMGLKMIALARITMRDINIAATTALQALADDGREQGLLAGANVIMPNATETKYRESYQLYENKPCTDENASMCQECLHQRIAKTGETAGSGKWGDSPHFAARQKNTGRSG